MREHIEDTIFMQAYKNLVGDYLVDSMSIILFKEELEIMLDRDISVNELVRMIKEQANLYKISIIRYKHKDHFGYIEIDETKIGEISIEYREDGI